MPNSSGIFQLRSGGMSMGIQATCLSVPHWINRGQATISFVWSEPNSYSSARTSSHMAICIRGISLKAPNSFHAALEKQCTLHFRIVAVADGRTTLRCGGHNGRNGVLAILPFVSAA